MSAKLVMPRCEQDPAHPNHPPPPDKPLRIQVLGLNTTLNGLFVNEELSSQEKPVASPTAFDYTGLQLATMVFRVFYGRDVDAGAPQDFTPRYQYNTFKGKRGECQPWEHTIDGYGITFDHLVDPTDDEDPETLMLNACDPNDPEMAQYLRLDVERFFTANESAVLLVPRCCQVRRGATDRKGINDQVRKTKRFGTNRGSDE